MKTTWMETTAVPKWKVGLWLWRVDGEWRLRLYRPWKREKMIEVQTADIRWAIYIVGIAAGWWKEQLNDNSTPR